MSGVAILACGAVTSAVVAETRDAIREGLSMESWVSDIQIDSAFALDAKRNQYNSALLLARVVQCKPPEADFVLGVTEQDLFIPMLSYVFGQAQVGGPGAIVSTARLRQEFYRLPDNDRLMKERLRKEVLHEFGHALSLIHCPDTTCVMALATGVRQVDMKSNDYCDACRASMGAARTMERSR